MRQANPFLDSPKVGEGEAEHMATDELLGELLTELGPASPLGTVSPGATWERGPAAHDRVAVVGLHGGAGASTVTRLLGEDVAVDTGGAIPLAGPALFVARTSGLGLARAQEAARAWSAHDFDEVDVRGLVLVAALPKLPKELRVSAKNASRMLPRCWHLGWQPGWHLSAQADVMHLDLRLRRTRTAMRGATALATQEVAAS